MWKFQQNKKKIQNFKFKKPFLPIGDSSQTMVQTEKFKNSNLKF